jgi:hypothetical protein
MWNWAEPAKITSVFSSETGSRTIAFMGGPGGCTVL